MVKHSLQRFLEPVKADAQHARRAFIVSGTLTGQRSTAGTAWVRRQVGAVMLLRVSARSNARRRQVARLLVDLTAWAERQDVHALVLVGSYARGAERMGSDVDVVVLTDHLERYGPAGRWFQMLRPDARLVRTATWGPVSEQRYRLRSGLLVEVGLAAPNWASVPLDPGTARVLGDGHRILHDRHATVARACASLGARSASGAPLP